VRLSRLIAAFLLVASPVPVEAAPPEVDEEFVVEGVRPGVFVREPTAVVDVWDVDDFTGEHKSLADLLSGAEGVFVRRFGGSADRSELSIRGSSAAQVTVEIDGIRTNSALTGGLDLSRICLPLVERVELARGRGAVGGSVNLVTRGASGVPERRIAFSGGAFETYEGSFFAADQLGAVALAAGYCGIGTEGDFEFARPEQETPGGGRISFVPDTSKRVNNDRVQHGASISGELPFAGGALRLSDYFAHSKGGEPGIDCCDGPTAGQDLSARSRDVSNLARLGWRGSLPGRLGDVFELAAYHRHESVHFEDDFVRFGTPIDRRTRISTFGGRLTDTWRDEIDGHAQSLRLDLDFAHDALEADDQPDRSRRAFGAGLDSTLDPLRGRFVLEPEIRLDWASGFDPELLPSLGVVVAPLSWLRLRASVSRAYRVPSFDELYHPDEGGVRGNDALVAEDAVNLDAGGELVLARLGPISELRLSGSWFRRDVDESIAWVQINDSTISPINTGSALVEGFELGLSFAVSRFVRLRANHTQLDSERDATGRELPGQPEHETNARLEIGADDIWKLVGEMQHTGEILLSEGGGRRLPSRTVWNASASLDLAALPGLARAAGPARIWIFASVDNIGDVAVRDTLSFPQPGRAATAGFEVRW
jgi:vitamin B12 transporter